MKKTILTCLLAFGSVIAASAGTIGPSCGSCFGGTYSLNGSLLNSNGGNETWRFTYTLQTQSVGTSNVSYISSIAAKVTSDVISASTVSNPTGGTWSNPKIDTGLNNSGCSGSGSGWVCIAWSSGSRLLTGSTAAASYSWVFDVTMASGSLLADASIKANFDPANGKILSEKISVPEGGLPLEFPLLLSGVGGWMFYSRRRSSKAAL